MKILYKISAAAAIVLSALSCTDLKFGNAFLEKSPGVDVTIDTIFSSKLYAERALVGAYATLRTGLTENNYPTAWECGGSYEFRKPGNKLGWDNLDSMTDIIHSYCTWGGTYKLYYNGTYHAGWENSDADDPNGLTKFGYNPSEDATWYGIRRAQLFIENVERVPDMSVSLKGRRTAEAKMIIACQMHEMLRHLGGVPIVLDPISTAAYDGNNQSGMYARRTIREVADYICQLCDEAAGTDPETGSYYLPWQYINDTDNGRFTRAAALALKCRVLDFIASPLFNSDTPYWTEGDGATKDPKASNANLEKIRMATARYNDKYGESISEDEYVKRMMWLGGYKAERWQAVVDACEAFFRANESEGNAYKLYEEEDDPRASFSSAYADRKSPEIIIHTCRTHAKFGNLYHIHYFGPTVRIQNGVTNNGVGYGGGCITLDYVDKFTTIDGRPARFEDWIKNGHADRKATASNSPFLNRDPRLYESVTIQWDTYKNTTIQNYVGGKAQEASNSVRVATGFNLRKFLWNYNDASLFDKVADYPYLRLPEIYLIYAEALNELGRSNEALAALDHTRERVGLPAMTWSLLNAVQKGVTLPEYSEPLGGNANLREEILDERAREFCFEEVRWFDIIRWKRDDIFTKSLRGITINVLEKTIDEAEEPVATSVQFSEPWKVEDGPIPNDRYWRKSFSTDQGRKWYFSAFPTDEVNKGYGLVQNPGWDVN